MLNIYASQVSPRLEYVLKVIFTEVLGIPFRITADSGFFRSSGEKKIAYSLDNIGDAIHLRPSGLLEEADIRKQHFRSAFWDDLPVIFADDNPVVPFDLFAAAFYLLTRYEEYLPFEPDQYGRFPAEQSIAFRGNFIRLPVIDLWCRKFARRLGIDSECRNIQPENYSFQLTVDIDQPWLYKHKGFLYSIAACFRDLALFNFAELTCRVKSLLGTLPDPGDTFGYLSEVQQRLIKPVKYFVLCRKKPAFDKNRSLNDPAFISLLKDIDSHKQVGIHPSYASNSDSCLLDQELSFLSAVLGRKVSFSRQHYLMLSFPGTFRNLLERGIEEEYSLGYSHLTGFRSGIARAYHFYDLLSDMETRLRIVPLHMMDRTMKDSMHLTIEQAYEECIYLTEQIRKVGGEFVCLWHNDSLGESGEWKGWRKVFQKLIDTNVR
jgi:hypothetical protein